MSQNAPSGHPQPFPQSLWPSRRCAVPKNHLNSSQIGQRLFRQLAHRLGRAYRLRLHSNEAAWGRREPLRRDRRRWRLCCRWAGPTARPIDRCHRWATRPIRACGRLRISAARCRCLAGRLEDDGALHMEAWRLARGVHAHAHSAGFRVERVRRARFSPPLHGHSTPQTTWAATRDSQAGLNEPEPRQ
mgnify:CR=1 FL=1